MTREQEVPKGYSIAVLHTHTTKSDGMVSPSRLVEAAAENRVRVLAITDHDTMAGVEEAKRVGARLGVKIVPGEEITTGVLKPKHIVGLNLERTVPSLKKPDWTIEQIKRRGGLVIIPHPLSGIAAFGEREIKNLTRSGPVDGIEALNGHGTNQEKRLNLLLADLGDKVGALLGTSDSHFGGKDLLASYTIFPGESLEDLLLAIKNRTTKPVQGSVTQIPLAERLKQHFRANVILAIRFYLLRNLK